MKRLAASALLALLLTVPNFETRGQPGIPLITDARVEGDTFVIEYTGPSQPPMAVQAADTLTGPWVDVPLPGQPPGGPALILIDRSQRFFRIRWETTYSANAAGYNRLAAPRGFSMIANHFRRGGNTLAEVLPSVPEGSMIYKHDAVRQIWSSASQFAFGAWSQPNETLASGEGALAFFTISTNLHVGGIVNSDSPSPQLQGRWNLISIPKPTLAGSGLPAPLDGDRIYQFVATSGAYTAYEFDFGAWSQEPSFGPVESFWYFRNSPNPGATGPLSCVYFNNRDMSVTPAIDAPFFDPTGCRIEGTNFLVELIAGPSPGNFLPVGDPLPFLTGNGAGYFDTRSGAIRYIPWIPPGSPAYVMVRLWDARSGATYAEAVAAGGARGQAGPFPITTGGAGTGYPPSVPTPMSGLQSFQPTGTLISSHPTNQTVFLGGTARFRVRISNFLPRPEFYQWQRSSDHINWVHIPGANSAELVIDPVTAESAGYYRVLADIGCASQASNPATLRVLPAPDFSNLQYMLPPNGGFMFTLKAEPAHNYRIDRSEDLTNWVTLTTLNNFDGEELIPDFGAQAFSHRFYRLTPLDP